MAKHGSDVQSTSKGHKPKHAAATAGKPKPVKGASAQAIAILARGDWDPRAAPREGAYPWVCPFSVSPLNATAAAYYAPALHANLRESQTCAAAMVLSLSAVGLLFVL
jgi:hypothetical protein